MSRSTSVQLKTASTTLEIIAGNGALQDSDYSELFKKFNRDKTFTDGTAIEFLMDCSKEWIRTLGVSDYAYIYNKCLEHKRDHPHFYDGAEMPNYEISELDHLVLIVTIHD